jgi:hypothetical protein
MSVGHGGDRTTTHQIRCGGPAFAVLLRATFVTFVEGAIGQIMAPIAPF